MCCIKSQDMHAHQNQTAARFPPQVGKLVYCTRTVPEMEKVLAELQVGCLGLGGCRGLGALRFRAVLTGVVAS